MELVKCRMQVQMMNLHSQNLAHRPKLSPISSTVAGLLSPTRPATLTPTFQATTPKPALQNLTAARTLPPLARHTFSLPTTSFRNVELPGPLLIVRSIYQEHGLKGFWLGQTGTMVRETGGCAVWFVVKEVVTDALQKQRAGLQSIGETDNLDGLPSRPMKGVTDIMPWESAIAGAAAGGTATLLFYPADTIKSAIQTEEELRPSSRRVQATIPSTFRRTAFEMYRAHVLKGL